MAKLTVKNWREFQHYKERNPPWIKLHHRMLDDYEFHCLPVASRALAPMLWLLASESEDGSIDYDQGKICYRLRTTLQAFEEALKPLINKGFVTCTQDASTALAECKQETLPETETETYKPEKSKNYSISQIEEIYETYPRKVGKSAALKAIEKSIQRLISGEKGSPLANRDEAIVFLMQRAGMFARAPAGRAGEFTPHPATWFNQSRYLDDEAEWLLKGNSNGKHEEGIHERIARIRSERGIGDLDLGMQAAEVDRR